MWCCASSIGLNGYTNLGDRPELDGKKKLGFWWVVFGDPKLLYMSLAWPQEHILTSDCYKTIRKITYEDKKLFRPRVLEFRSKTEHPHWFRTLLESVAWWDGGLITSRERKRGRSEMGEGGRDTKASIP